jgi:hypothetical protein
MFPKLKGLNMSEPKSATFKHYMGTFLLRRAHYFSEAGHQLFPVAGQEKVVAGYARNVVPVRG